MRIAIIGSGRLGTTAARLLAQAGHDVALANSRGPGSLAGVVAGLGERVRAASIESAAATADLVLVAIPFERFRELPAEALAGKLVVDAMNHFPGGGELPSIDAGATTSSELVATHLRSARVVKAFNTMQWQVLGGHGSADGGDGRLALFVAGDDEDGKHTVSRLIDEIGFAPVDTGGLAAGGRRQQPGSPLFTELARRRRARLDPPGITAREARRLSLNAA
jgi:8-hydroxy-5-deazaflavin:NADPH oxidoreductase